jgi:exonuclease 1
MDRVESLIRSDVVPLVVFDGAELPSKRVTERARAEKRASAVASGRELLAMGRRSDAHSAFAVGVDVTPEMQHDLMVVSRSRDPGDARRQECALQALRERGVSFLVAPYEADAQLAFLCRKGIVDAVITEDSDTLPYCCNKVLFKLEPDGSATLVERTPNEGFFAKRTNSSGTADAINLAGFRDSMFLDMCILAGCDYCPSLPKVGIKAAWRLIRDRRSLSAALSQLRVSGAMLSQPEYAESARRAKATFCFQRVWDPCRNAVVPLCSLEEARAMFDLAISEEEVASLEYLGAMHSPAVGAAIASGRIHPQTLELYPGEALEEPSLSVPEGSAVEEDGCASVLSRAEASTVGTVVEYTVLRPSKHAPAQSHSSHPRADSRGLVQRTLKVVVEPRARPKIQLPKPSQTPTPRDTPKTLVVGNATSEHFRPDSVASTVSLPTLPSRRPLLHRPNTAPLTTKPAPLEVRQAVPLSSFAYDSSPPSLKDLLATPAAVGRIPSDDLLNSGSKSSSKFDYAATSTRKHLEFSEREPPPVDPVNALAAFARPSERVSRPFSRPRGHSPVKRPAPSPPSSAKRVRMSPDWGGEAEK